MPPAHAAALASLAPAMRDRVVLLRHAGPGGRWRTQAFWATADEASLRSAERDFAAAAAKLEVGGVALWNGRVLKLRMAGA